MDFEQILEYEVIRECLRGKCLSTGTINPGAMAGGCADESEYQQRGKQGWSLSGKWGDGSEE